MNSVPKKVHPSSERTQTSMIDMCLNEPQLYLNNKSARSQLCLDTTVLPIEHQKIITKHAAQLNVKKSLCECGSKSKGKPASYALNTKHLTMFEKENQ